MSVGRSGLAQQPSTAGAVEDPPLVLEKTSHAGIAKGIPRRVPAGPVQHRDVAFVLALQRGALPGKRGREAGEELLNAERQQ